MRTYGGALTDWLMSARVLSDGNIIAVGTTTSNTINGELHESHGEQDALIIKLSPDGIPI